jgi:putative glycosyltransferase
MQLSIVTTLYASALHLDEFCTRALRAAESVAGTCELILVNDGSPDVSLRIALDWHARDARVRVLDLSRHYGHYPAILAGLARARGDRVFVIDADLEEPPELLERCWAPMAADSDVDVVVCVQARRRGGWWTRASGALFYRALASGTPLAVVRNSMAARLLSRRVVDALVALPERPVDLDVLTAAAGFRQVTVEATKGSSSPSTYSLPGKVALATRSLVAHHQGLPWLVAAAALVAAAIGLTALARAVWIVGERGTALILASIWLVGALVLAALSLLGHYGVALLDETRRRPTLVRREYTRP